MPAVQCYVPLVLFHGMESWTLTKATIKKREMYLKCGFIAGR